jgi:hypothetical protein
MHCSNAQLRRTLAALAGVALAALPPPTFAFFAAFFSFVFSSRSRFRFAASRCLAACTSTGETQVKGNLRALHLRIQQGGGQAVEYHRDMLETCLRHACTHMAVPNAAHAPALQGPSCWWPLA